MTDYPRVGALVVTHGQLGHELVAAAEMIVGPISHMAAVSIGWHDDMNESRKGIEQAIQSLNQGKGVIILTDMFGGTPCSVSLALQKKGELEIVTGVNLPMIIKLANQGEDETLTDLAQKVRDQGQQSISIAGEVLGE